MPQDVLTAYLQGVFVAELGIRLSGYSYPTESEINAAKECAVKILECQIDSDDNLTAIQKEDTKSKMRAWAEFAIQGCKDRLRACGKWNCYNRR